MGGNLSVRNLFGRLRDGLFSHARLSRHSIERGLRHVLDESGSPSCCSIEKVAHIRSLVGPVRKDADGEEATGEPRLIG